MPITYRKRRSKRKQITKRTTKRARKHHSRRNKQTGGKYNEKQKKVLRKKFREFGFDNNEINTLLTKMDHTSQLFALNLGSISQQLDVYHRHYESGSEEQKSAVRQWVDELNQLDDMVDTDYEKEDTE
jgi:hypothetical protein